MSIEQRIDKLNVNLEALIGAVALLVAAQGGKAAEATVQASTEKPAADKGGKGKGRPSAEDVDPFADAGGGSDDGMGGEDDGMGGEDGDGGPTYTLDDVKKAMFELRDLGVKKIGKEEGMKNVRSVLNKFATKIEEIKEEDFAAAIKAATAAVEALNKKKK